MHISLSLGAVRAEVDTVAAALRSLSVGGVALTEPRVDDREPPFCNGIVLAPWPNRVRDARWVSDGVVQQLDISEPAHGGALHGLLAFTDFDLVTSSDDAVTLGAFIAPQHGWPFALETGVRYALEPDGIRVTHTVRNVSAARSPCAVGAHPFLRVGDTPVDALTLTATAETFFEVDDALNPTAEVPVTAEVDLRAGRRIGGLRLDTAYGTLTHAEDGASAWLEAPDGARTTLWQDPDWGYLQVFTTTQFPRPEGLGTAVAVEPMTAPPDALNSGQGLIWIEPDGTWEGSWGIRVSPGTGR